ncbi:hypothetical protein LGR51_21860 [Pseudomonas sp. NP21570]|uniref:hypothetical protein n=1 Tax=Stutzerimonas kunmingensis TaxID=1211807 RepID=UPI001E43FE93|nr:hypothetical protein [Stutzerimonas kunmingensis]MCB4797134.1 hypothetical protein [Pseudomonas sp. NP21570]
MLEEGAFSWTTGVGVRVARSLIADLADIYQHELVEHRRHIKDRYPPSVLSVAATIELASLLMRDRPELQDLAEELLLVSALALHRAFDAGHADTAQSLASEIDLLAEARAPILYKDICPVAF